MEQKQTIAEIAKQMLPILEHYRVRYAILFGQFDNGTVPPNQDLQMLLDADLNDFGWVNLIEDLEDATEREVFLHPATLTSPLMIESATCLMVIYPQK
ncbi:MAG: hypothetical protein E7433_02930 [Ruminococcaceae bacterium]|nr:hypothetical protein [Oscillospiraceae bacterium]